MGPDGARQSNCNGIGSGGCNGRGGKMTKMKIFFLPHWFAQHRQTDTPTYIITHNNDFRIKLRTTTTTTTTFVKLN